MAGKPAARIRDHHICPLCSGSAPHVGGPCTQGSTDVLIGGSGAARVGDRLTCAGPPDTLLTGSATVFINSRPAARLGDSTSHGGTVVAGCTTVMIGDDGPVSVQGSVAPSKPCRYCQKPEHSFRNRGSYKRGNSSELERNIQAEHPKEEHDWYSGKNALAAHHLICCELMDTSSDWQQYCADFGYNINRAKNGVRLPQDMPLACQAHAQRHRGNHAQGMAASEPYLAAVRKKLDKLQKQVESGNFCENPDDLTAKLDALSAMILTHINQFEWTIARDSSDYKPGSPVGCGGARAIDQKSGNCPEGRAHGITRYGSQTVIAPGKVLHVGE